jgi:hypothetical protein
MATADEARDTYVESSESARQIMQELQARMDSDFDLLVDIYHSLIPAYMKPTTATLEDSMRTDAARDAKFLAIAADAVLAELKARKPQ